MPKYKMDLSLLKTDRGYSLILKSGALHPDQVPFYFSKKDAEVLGAMVPGTAVKLRSFRLEVVVQKEVSDDGVSGEGQGGPGDSGAEAGGA